MSLRLWDSGGRRSPLLGIDLGAGQVRLMACSGSRRAWSVSHCAQQELPPDAFDGPRLRQFDQVAGLLRELARGVGGRPQAALAMPEEALRRERLTLPATLRPWQWRTWLRAQAERLGQAPAEGLVFDVQSLGGPALALGLTVCPRELVEDWQGLAEAAGLRLVLLDDRPRVMRMALAALGLGAAAGHDELMAEAWAERCRLHTWRPGQVPQMQDLRQEMPQARDTAARSDPIRPAQRWLVANAVELPPWSEQLQALDGGAWRAPGLGARLRWSPGTEPREADGFLAALGLALRQWQV